MPGSFVGDPVRGEDVLLLVRGGSVAMRAVVREGPSGDGVAVRDTVGDGVGVAVRDTVGDGVGVAVRDTMSGGGGVEPAVRETISGGGGVVVREMPGLEPVPDRTPGFEPVPVRPTAGCVGTREKPGFVDDAPLRAVPGSDFGRVAPGSVRGRPNGGTVSVPAGGVVVARRALAGGIVLPAAPIGRFASTGVCVVFGGGCDASLLRRMPGR